MSWEIIIGVLITMVFSAFFSGMEIAFVSSNRMLAEMDKEKDGLSKRCLSVFYSHPNNFVSTMLVGNNIALVVYGILIAKLFDDTIFKGMSAGFTVPADTILSTIIVLFTGEFLPKTLFKSLPNRLLYFFALPAFVCYVLLWPISKFATLLARIILRAVGVKMNKEGDEEAFTKGQNMILFWVKNGANLQGAPYGCYSPINKEFEPYPVWLRMSADGLESANIIGIFDHHRPAARRFRYCPRRWARACWPSAG